MSLGELLEALEACRKCDFIDKPFLVHGAYEWWLPGEVKLLLIAESPPPGQKPDFFYNLGAPDRLRRNLKAILGLEVPDTEVPRWLRESGIFLTSAVKCRPIRPGGWARDERLLRQMALNCTAILDLELRALRPKKVVVMGKVAELASGTLGLRPYRTFPHPNYIVRFRRELIPAVRKAVFDAISDP